VYVRVGRYSPFIEQGDRTASLADETPPDEVTLEAALALLEQAQQGEEPLGTCPETLKPVYLKVGRFGPYVQRGNPDDEDKPQNASLLKGMNPADGLNSVAAAHAAARGAPAQSTGAAQRRRTVRQVVEKRGRPADLSPLDVTLA
jgi:DNA topoisomerase-1